MSNYRYVSDRPPEYRPMKLSMKSIVKILGYNFGYKTCFRILRVCGVLDQYSTPHQQYIDEGYFVEDMHEMQKGFKHIQTYVNGKHGLEFVKKTIDEYLANNPIPKGTRRSPGKKGPGFILIDDVS